MPPRLVYDGDCGFCRYTVAYARAVTGDAVEYRPYQQVAAHYDDVSEAEFAASIVLFADHGHHRGARAAFETLAYGGRRGWLWLYLHVPGTATLCERLYRLTSTHREASYRLARLLFGARLGPRRHARTADRVYRGIAFCGLLAFVSFWWQALGLIGADGVLPLTTYLDAVADTYGAQRWWLAPTLLWLHSGDLAIYAVCAAGVVACALGSIGRMRLCSAVVAYGCYLSLIHGGQVFMAYQWDILLAECLVLAVVLSRSPTVGVWLTRLLLFRFMLLSGVAKLMSGDPTWADGSALEYHFETQPLPTVLAWYAHQLPREALALGVQATLLVELVLPFLIFLPRNLRFVAGMGFVALELLIGLTGNYNFFNLLTIVLCVALLDDKENTVAGGVDARPRRWGMWALAVLIGLQGLGIVFTTLMQRPLPAVFEATRPLYVANPYGLFAVMTTRRDELVVEGSMDGEHWSAYGFRFKPQEVGRAPVWVAPHQPRLDWQMWFAALGPPEQAPWIYDLVFALLRARPAVLGLLDDPFSGERPVYVRVRIARWRFTTPDERRSSGDWWVAGATSVWLPPIRLRKPVVRHEPLRLD